MQEMLVLSLGQEDPLEEEMATHSSIIAWEIPWTEEPAGLQSAGLQNSRTKQQLYCIPKFVHPFSCRWTFQLFPIYSYCE